MAAVSGVEVKRFLLHLVKPFWMVIEILIVLSFGQARKWWAWAIVSALVLGFWHWQGLLVGEKADLLPVMIFVGFTAGACAMRKRWEKRGDD
ncbi:hypothetical protein [uncultured Litoreibacter sp.]|uniref:hypothetical protein n=1 Tax=uncultured Litoreibacter sp. TaxID=1392394 RepID=UPI002618501B|nr:hypothetical protein [uncultured Litoreibacter sp.]